MKRGQNHHITNRKSDREGEPNKLNEPRNKTMAEGSDAKRTLTKLWVADRVQEHRRKPQKEKIK